LKLGPGARDGKPFSPGMVLSILLLILLVLPLVALSISATPREIWWSVRRPVFLPALWLSLRTTTLSLLFIVLSGTPLAFWLATTSSRAARWVTALVSLPIVVPPAVLGVALLQTFGQRGPLGPLLSGMGVELPFSEPAVILAQVMVAAPFYVQAAAGAFRKVDADHWIVARTLGASPRGAFYRLALPIALPGLVGGAALAFARALGEFGATLLFAGNMPGRTQTMPLAIVTAMESELSVAIAFSLVLLGFGAVVLVLLSFTETLGSRLESSGASDMKRGGHQP
jgi:molybdate transport system permease protein